MKLQQISASCYAILNEKNRLCDANSGFIDRGGGLLVDTQCDLAHARQMIELLSDIDSTPPKYVVNTHEDMDHVWGNQLFRESEILAHRTVPERMREVADPTPIRKLDRSIRHLITRTLVRWLHPGLYAVGLQLQEEYNFDDIELAFPTRLFDERCELELDGIAVHMIYVGPCHQVGDAIVHVPQERVVFAGDIVFQ
ncbi:MAG: MBL fold metallo-hydrolase, partial [Rubripirellula sp.]